MTYQGGCHCGAISIQVQGEIGEVYECNCSLCSKRGYLLWFVDRSQVTVTGESAMATYRFNTHKIGHHFCPTCGCAPMGSAGDKAAINVRCLDAVDVKALTIKPVDGRSIPMAPPAAQNA
ncbi:GFA family protein [Tahibacter amnicola]|uniref:GFA family protein n=1 Tax=Tahibacter amnicola TaxID=2976241 RepID=A0ABY6BJA6_9GAMM|nr:GFA family protein [Tahibacter amnicola]UXI69930.1 GFA family protein [Tahibacter amnicola]